MCFWSRLYDNPQLVQTYLDAFRITGNLEYAFVARGILDYLLRDMLHPKGGFFSAEVICCCKLPWTGIFPVVILN